jgi:RecA/RadA recombinase
MPRKANGKARVDALADVARRFCKFRPAREVLHVVRAVPTRFVQLDHATRVGGLPIERFMLLHGPSNEGKSLLALGLCDSFISRGHVALYIDAERTTPSTWAEQLMGGNARSDRFFAERPESYEDTIKRVREFLNTVAGARSKHPSLSALVVVDSLRKLVPKDLMREILQAEREDGGARGKGRPRAAPGRDRGAQLKAKMNAAWMDELIPLLEHAGAAFVAVAREMVDPDADAWQRRFGNDYKVGGGGAIYYDASLAMRVERAAWVHNGEEGPKHLVYGERHRVTIRKTKVGAKDDRESTCHFHSSNGVLVPFGFDRARDLVELGVAFGVVKQKGGWLTWQGKRWQGAHVAVKKLHESERDCHPDFCCDLANLEVEVRAAFRNKPPVAHAAGGEVVG